MEVSPSYFSKINFNIIHCPHQCGLCDLQMQNHMFNSHFLHATKVSVPGRGFVKHSVSSYGDELLAVRPISKMEDAPCRKSTSASSIYHQLPYLYGRHLLHRKLRTRHTVLTGTQLERLMIHCHYYYHHYHHHHPVYSVPVTVLLKMFIL